MVYRPIQSRCPEFDFRNSLSDGEFWDYVFNGIAGPEMPVEEPETDELVRPPCIECGSIGACGYDEMGRPMIHCVDSEELLDRV